MDKYYQNGSFAKLSPNSNPDQPSNQQPAKQPNLQNKIDKPKVVSQSQKSKADALFAIKSQCSTTTPTPTPGKVSKKQDRAILPK